MAQTITIAGTTYPDVPSISVPKSGGGSVSFTDVSDTTAAASDVAQGKYFYTAAGEKTVGTASGGASNVVTGTFTTGSTGGTAQTVTIPYSGSGYPIAAYVYVTGGPYNSDNTAIYNSTQRYAIVMWNMVKSETGSEPTYKSTGKVNYGATLWTYKNSTSNANTYARSGTMAGNTFSNAAADSTTSTIIRFTSATKMSVYVSDTSYGLFRGTSYTYHIIYSS